MSNRPLQDPISVIFGEGTKGPKSGDGQLMHCNFRIWFNTASNQSCAISFDADDDGWTKADQLSNVCIDEIRIVSKG